MSSSFAADLLESLNPPQREAVTCADGALLIIAGAGSGKTRVITHRIAYLLGEKKVLPWQILAATFTNKAAREMKERVIRLCSHLDVQRLSIATFHSHCARILRNEAEAVGLTARYSICDESDQTAVVRDAIKQLDYDPKSIPPRDVLEVISAAKMRLLEGDAAEEAVEAMRGREYAEIYSLYQHRLRSGDAVDFDDLILLVVLLWQRNPDILAAYQDRYHYLLVDEYQDTNLAQFEFLRLLAGQRQNLCVVGDEDQSIYSWRGAELSNLLEFQRHFPGARLIRLEQNYRSTGNILNAAGAVIARNTQRLGKTLWTEQEAGDPIVVIDAMSDTDEARMLAAEILRLNDEGLPLDEMAIFYRINALSRIYEDALREENIPYRVVGGMRFYDRAEIKDLLAYMQVVDNPTNTLSLLRILNKPRRGLGDKSVSALMTYADARQLALFQVVADPEHASAAGLKGKTAASAVGLGELILKWAEAAPSLALQKLANMILKDTDYESSLGDPRSIETLSRQENIQEFLGSLKQFQDQQPKATLREYLESVTLRAAESEEETASGVSLMTAHNAKGLEFTVVFIPALEDEIFPSGRAVREQGNLEEERRLFYVALTRARRRAYLSWANRRQLYGQPNWPAPSIFLHEIPGDLKKGWMEARLPPIRSASPAGVRDSRPSETVEKPAAAPRKRLFRHKLLGEVEWLSESGSGSDLRVVVRDLRGQEFTLLAAHAHLQPIREAEIADAGPASPDDDALPF